MSQPKPHGDPKFFPILLMGEGESGWVGAWQLAKVNRRGCEEGARGGLRDTVPWPWQAKDATARCGEACGTARAWP